MCPLTLAQEPLLCATAHLGSGTFLAEPQSAAVRVLQSRGKHREQETRPSTHGVKMRGLLRLGSDSLGGGGGACCCDRPSPQTRSTGDKRLPPWALRLDALPHFEGLEWCDLQRGLGPASLACEPAERECLQPCLGASGPGGTPGAVGRSNLSARKPGSQEPHVSPVLSTFTVKTFQLVTRDLYSSKK